MALVNCSINSGTLTKVGGQPIDADANTDVTLVITPIAYHSVKASNFSHGTLPTEVSSITFADTGIAGTYDNKVNVLVELNNSFTMPNQNHTITIDVDGAADKGTTFLTTVSGENKHVVDSTVTVTTSQTSQHENYSKTSTPSNQAITLFTKNFAAATNETFTTNPDTCFTIESPNLDRYEVAVVENTGSFSAGTLTNYTLTIKYKFPQQDSLEDRITYVARTKTNITPTNNKIYRYAIDVSSINYFGETRSLTLIGDPGAQLKIDAYVTSVSGTSLLGSEFNGTGKTVTLSSNGTYVENIVFPENTTSAGVDFTVKLTEVTGYDFVFNSGNSPKTIALVQYPLSGVTFSVSRTSTTGMTIPTNTYNQTGTPLQDPDEYLDEYTSLAVSWVVNSSGGFWRTPTQPTNLNITGSQAVTNSERVTIANNGEVNGNLTAVVDNTSSPKKVTISGDYTINRFPSIPTNAVLNLDSIISLNTAPTTSNTSFTANASGATTHGLSATDADGDSLTYSVVTAPSKGTLAISTNGVATYTVNVGQSGSDLFRFKVNDGIQDSNTSTVTVTLGSSSVFSYNTVYKYKDLSSSSPSTEYNMSAVFSGTLNASNLVAGSENNVTLQVTNWSVDDTSAGVPTYQNDKYDFDEVFYRIKNASGTVINHGSIPINYTASSFNNEARTGTVATSVLDTSTNNLSAESHTIEIILAYKNNATP
jgi:hypothetical protein